MVARASERAHILAIGVLEPLNKAVLEYVLIVHMIARKGLGPDESRVLDQPLISRLSEPHDLSFCLREQVIGGKSLQKVVHHFILRCKSFLFWRLATSLL